MSVYIGFTTDKGLIIDLDQIKLEKVTRIAKKLNTQYNLNGYLIMESSPEHYHLIFNEYLNWKDITKILFNFNKNSVIGWAINQMRRGDLTLRISTNRGSKPKIITQEGASDRLINDYLTIYDLFKEY